MSQEYSLVARILAKTDEFTKAMGDAGKKTDEFSKNFETKTKNLSQGMKNVGSALTKSVSLPLAGIATFAIKTAIDFESAFAGVRKTVDATEDEFAGLKQGIRDMSKEIPVSAIEIAKVAENAGQLGIEKENILGFTRTMVDLGVATNMTADEASMALAQFANATNMPQENFDRLGSTIVALGNNTATTESQIVNMAGYLAGSATQAGMSQAQIMSVSAAMSSMGISAERGGGSMSRVITEMTNSVANGGKGLEQFASVAGVSASEFSTAFEQDAGGALEMFISGLGKMQGEGENINPILDEMGFSGLQVSEVLKTMASGSGTLTDALKIGTDAWNENTALQTEAEQKYATVSSQLTIMWNKIKDIALTLGDAFLPILMDVIDMITPWIEKIAELATWFGELDPSIHRVVAIITGLIIVIGPLLVVFGTIIGFLPAIVAGFGILVTAIGAITAPVWIVIAAIAALIAIGVALWANWDEVVAFVGKSWDFIRAKAVEVFAFVATYITTKFTEIKNIFNTVLSFIVTYVTSKFQSITDSIRNHMDAARGLIASIWNTISTYLKTTISNIVTEVRTRFNNMKDNVSTALNNIKNTASNIWNNVKNTITNAVSSAVDTARTRFDNFKNNVSTIFNNMKNTASNIFNGIKSAITNAVSGTVDIAKSRFDNMKNNLSNAFNSIKNTTYNIWNNVKTAITSPIESAKNTVSRLVDTIKGFFTGMKLSIPKISMPKLPKFSLSGKFSLNPPSVPKIAVNWNALGGIFSKPTIFNTANAGMQGVGEAGAEAIIPLTKSVLSTIGDKIFSNMSALPTGGKPITVENTFNFNVAGNMDGRQMKKIANYVAGVQLSGLKKRGG